MSTQDSELENNIIFLLDIYAKKVKSNQDPSYDGHEFLTKLIFHKLRVESNFDDSSTYTSIITAFDIYAKSKSDNETKEILKEICVKTIINALLKKDSQLTKEVIK